MINFETVVCIVLALGAAAATTRLLKLVCADISATLSALLMLGGFRCGQKCVPVGEMREFPLWLLFGG